MKKLLTIMLAVCLLFTMTTAVFADVWIPEEEEPITIFEKDGFLGGMIVAAILILLLIAVLVLYLIHKKRR